jgi:putative tryptophan/tyrosine transport system substrate-binding protein
VRRRHLLALVGATAGAGGTLRPAFGQKLPRVGFLLAGDPEPTWNMFRNAMAGLGYVDGRTVKYEYRAADAASGRLDELAADLVRLEVDVIVAALTPAIMAAKRATSRIPIVFNGGAPETGMVTNVARPEGNLTGVFGATSVLAGKSVQLFREIKPTLKAIGVIVNAPDPFHLPLLREIESVGRAEGIEIVPAMARGPDELTAVYDSVARRGVDGLIVQPSLPIDVTAGLALKYHLPAISFRRQFADAGGFLSLGANQMDLNRTVAGYVDKLLKGGRTADLPVQLATRYELVVNQKTAKALGISLSPLFLARVDEVIE